VAASPAATVLAFMAMLVLLASFWAWLVAAAKAAITWRLVGDSAASRVAALLQSFGISPRLPLVPWNPRQSVPWTGVDLMTLIGLYVLTSAAAALIADDAHNFFIAFGWFEILVTKDESLIIAGIAASLLLLVIGLPLISVRTGATSRDFGWSLSDLVHDLKLGLVAFVMLAPPVYATQGLLVSFWQESKHPLIEMFKEQPNIDFFAILFVSAAFIAPLFEEMVFRVLLQGFLEKIFVHPLAQISTTDSRQHQPTAALVDQHDYVALSLPSDANPYASPRLGGLSMINAEPIEALQSCPSISWLAIVISSAIFALLHYSHGPDWIPLFILALGLGYLYQCTHRLVPSLVVHSLLNAFSMWGLWITVHQQDLRL
jgi:membrane protease YdiL (CAAX protease family)